MLQNADFAKFLANFRLLPTIIIEFLKKFVHSKTVDCINSHHIITLTEYGFRSNHSTIYAILDIITSTYDSIKNRMFTGLVLLDLAKAFDTTNRDILLQKLHHYGIRGIVNNFLLSFLKNRT